MPVSHLNPQVMDVGGIPVENKGGGGDRDCQC